MLEAPIVIGLPIVDRRTSFSFYRGALDLRPFGDLAEDGLPEPLQFELSPGVNLTLVPTAGFDWVTGANDVAAKGTSECVITITVNSETDVGTVMRRAVQAGGDPSHARRPPAVGVRRNVRRPRRTPLDGDVTSHVEPTANF